MRCRSQHGAELTPSPRCVPPPGKACVLKSLLDVHRVFRENEPAYIHNDLYVSDYCVWIQRVK